jgi:lysophospholipase L1-like esterase
MSPQSHELPKNKNFSIVLVVLLVVLIGIYAVIGTHASSPYSAGEAENGTLTGSVSITHNTAESGGAYVSFKANPCLTVIESSCTLNIGWVGDSITQGGNGCDEHEVNDAVSDLQSDGYTVNSDNQGHSGYGTDDWEAGSSTLISAESSFAAAGVHVVSVMLGTNDARNPAEYAENVPNLAPQQHFANMQGIVSSLTKDGFIVVLEEPIYTTPGGDGLWPSNVNTVYAQYWALDDTLVNNVNVFKGDTSASTVMSQSGDLCTDGIHPSVAGAAVLGRLWANAVEGKDAS